VTYAAITGWGMAVPPHALSNADLARSVSGIDEDWIVRRTGILQRHIAGPEDTTSTLSARAGRWALARAGIDPEQLDVIIVATCTPDTTIPATAPRVQAAIGASRAGAFDVNAACAGFLTALGSAHGLICAGAAERALVIGAEVLSRFLDWENPKTCVLFGDGAGAVVLERSEAPAGLLSFAMGADGEGAALIEMPAGGSARPASEASVAAREHTIRMNGPEVFRAAVRIMADASERALAAAGLVASDADLVILHQANQRIIDEVGRRLGTPQQRVFSNVAGYGNTSAASIPIAICEAADRGLLWPGARLVLSAVGAGLTWTSAVVRWTGARTDIREETPDVVEVLA